MSSVFPVHQLIAPQQLRQSTLWTISDGKNIEFYRKYRVCTPPPDYNVMECDKCNKCYGVDGKSVRRREEEKRYKEIYQKKCHQRRHSSNHCCQSYSHYCYYYCYSYCRREYNTFKIYFKDTQKLLKLVSNLILYLNILNTPRPISLTTSDSSLSVSTPSGNPQSSIIIIATIRIILSLSDQPGAPYFNETNISKFLNN